MVLIHKMDKRPAHEKLEELGRFCERELNTVLGRELQVAAYYFAGFAGKLVRMDDPGSMPSSSVF